jgi:general secretion pathway protein I
MKASARFTLIEVLVALGIVAIALVAGLQATAALTNNAQRQSTCCWRRCAPRTSW